MQLIKVRLHGYKRFAEESTMNVDGKVIAIIGPNEAGKSSFLQALEHFNHNDKFVPQNGRYQLTRGAEITDEQKVIWGLFRLDNVDRAEISTDEECFFHIKLVEIWKTKDGKRNCQLCEPLPRDESIRQGLKAALETNSLRTTKNQLPQKIEKLLEFLAKPRAEKKFADLVSELKEAKDIQQQIQQKGNETLRENLTKYIEDENARQALEKKFQERLLERVPKFLLFDEENRSLKSEYPIGKITQKDKAIHNLLKLAKVNLNDLKTSLQSRDFGAQKTWEVEANSNLEAVYENKWGQSDITASFDIDGNTLRIQVGERPGKNLIREFSSISERSDGARFFIALAAFIEVSREEKPILLIDEAERHLHYDAQADLMQMFYEQEVTAKIIYTTHSAGCLPEDLGTSIRAIKPEEDYKSSIYKLWEGNAKGFRPLFLAMGASTLAFNSARRVLFSEGESDCLLLPALFKEAADIEYLGFQILPGLSQIPKGTALELEQEGRSVAYLVDGEETGGGAAIKKQLIKEGISEDKIFSLGKIETGIDVERLVSQEIYDEAKSKSINKEQKIEVAQQILNQKGDGKSIVRECYRKPLKELYHEIAKALKVPRKES